MSSKSLPVFTNDEYNKVLTHIQQCDGSGACSAGCLSKHWLLLAFNPLIVRVAMKFRQRWTDEFGDLVLLVRAKFIRLLHRYDVKGRWYFRYYMPRALFYEVRDAVYKDRRSQGLQEWHDTKPTPRPDFDDEHDASEVVEGLWMRQDDQGSDLHHRLTAQAVMVWLRDDTSLAGSDKTAFLMHVQGHNCGDIRRLMRIPPERSVQAAIDRVRLVLRTRFLEAGAAAQPDLAQPAEV